MPTDTAQCAKAHTNKGVINRLSAIDLNIKLFFLDVN